MHTHLYTNKYICLVGHKSYLMRYKNSLIRLPMWATTEVEKYAQEKGLAFATAVRCIVVEYLKENTPAANPAKMPADAASAEKGAPACR